jgi:DNA-binding CsgD family transcriptional regulator
MSVYQPSSLTVLLQQEAVERIESVERQIAKAVWAKVDSMPVARHDTLSPKELQTLLGMISGISLADDAERRGVSLKTLQTHQQRIREKLGIPYTRDIVKYAFKIAFERGKP